MDKELVAVSYKKIQDWDWETYISYGQTIRSLKDGCQWSLGDLSRGITKKYGKDSLGKFAREIGVNEKSLMEYRRIAKAYPRKKDRLIFLSWSHHQRALKSENPTKLLEKAHDEEWSIRQMDRYLIEKKSADCQHEYKKFLICQKCGHKIPIDKVEQK